MNEHQLGRLLRRVILLSAPLPLTMLGAACGGSVQDFNGVAAGAGSTTAGAGNAAGSGLGGAGAGGATAGEGGAGAAAGAGTGTAGAGTGTAGSGNAGAGGAPNVCKGNLAPACMFVTVKVPASCIGDLVVIGAPLPQAKCFELCSLGASGCRVTALESDGMASLSCDPGCAVGRRPAGFGAPAPCEPNALGDYFAEVARLEAASVTAFRILRDELREQGAPKRLVRAAGRAARDEIRHARSTGALARRFGGQPRTPSLVRVPRRSLEAMAIENAIEGCVRETYGALVATRQAQHARDPQVQAAMTRIARDETRHAALSWSVARWLESRLDGDAKRNVERAKLAAARELSSSIANEAEPSFADLAGLPSRTEALALAAQLERALWS
ncbi:MAG TPA: ferritin-like domain-containing protein [Polyangiaceae bacterium]|nr:ferritin-like domain-containing protein [Polyangiaceae bacterium]